MGVRLRGRAILFLLAIVLLGALRAWDAGRLLREPPPSLLPSPPLPAVAEPEDLIRARALDRMAEAWRDRSPPRDPFRERAGPAKAAPTPLPGPVYAIPRALVVADGEGGKRVVLSFGREQSRPLAAGESERGWRVLSIEKSKVLVENDGVIYTLPLP